LASLKRKISDLPCTHPIPFPKALPPSPSMAGSCDAVVPDIKKKLEEQLVLLYDPELRGDALVELSKVTPVPFPHLQIIHLWLKIWPFRSLARLLARNSGRRSSKSSHLVMLCGFPGLGWFCFIDWVWELAYNCGDLTAFLSDWFLVSKEYTVRSLADFIMRINGYIVRFPSFDSFGLLYLEIKNLGIFYMWCLKVWYIAGFLVCELFHPENWFSRPVLNLSEVDCCIHYLFHIHDVWYILTNSSDDIVGI